MYRRQAGMPNISADSRVPQLARPAQRTEASRGHPNAMNLGGITLYVIDSTTSCVRLLLSVSPMQVDISCRPEQQPAQRSFHINSEICEPVPDVFPTSLRHQQYGTKYRTSSALF